MRVCRMAYPHRLLLTEESDLHDFLVLVGAGIVIEKAYQPGGKLIRDMGVRVESLARIASMSVEDGIRFC